MNWRVLLGRLAHRAGDSLNASLMQSACGLSLGVHVLGVSESVPGKGGEDRASDAPVVLPGCGSEVNLALPASVPHNRLLSHMLQSSAMKCPWTSIIRNEPGLGYRFVTPAV